MYKKTHKANQSRANRLTIADLQMGGSDLTEDQRRAMLKEQLQHLHLRLEELPKNHPERKILGKRMFLLNEEMSKLKQTKRPDIAQCFVDAAFNLLKPEVYHAIYEEAKHIHDIRQSKGTYAAIERRKAMQIQDALKVKTSKG